ncbi:hypothetical protein FZEAL_2889 [Fusarium zealandicum]|uniref:Phenylacetaldoxime dehydratase n=1 Tax=Fusarium zealandicum TaxID=1053134 RepID=A0A8H4XMB1_9HYPO|nr:hypothetical protein FZEAL_2889 [Fusarium zealandicum]
MSENRVYPLKRPQNHQPPVPRWQLAFENGVDHVFTAYIGIQQRSRSKGASEAKAQAEEFIIAWLGEEVSDRPTASESFSMIDGNDVRGARVWVCYWLNEAKFHEGLKRLSLGQLFAKLPSPGRESIGVWQERFSSQVSRLETNYSGLDYLPGLAKLPGTGTAEHTLTAYWGAARDRIPDSAHDLFPQDHVTQLKAVPQGVGQHLVGSNYDNIVHIRSGQFWENCGGVETNSYEEKLEPTLQAGLEYLWDNPVDGGAVGLRYLRNTDPLSPGSDSARKETCAAGFFTSLGALEGWAKSHRSHLAIFKGALAHAKVFGDDRKFRTWHEVSVLRRGDVRFEYINCASETGVMRFIPLEEQTEGAFQKL